MADLRAAISYFSTLPQVDASRILAVGHSAGGFASVALTADHPANVVAAISFAGGRGSLSPGGNVCAEEALRGAFRSFGTTSRTPRVWVYSENDQFFDPAMGMRFRDSFESGGNRVEFVVAPAVGTDGHALFTDAIPEWTLTVDRFLAEHHLTVFADPLPLPPVPQIPAPAPLGAKGQQAFSKFLGAPPHKAFAVSTAGRFGWRSGRRTPEEARAEALKSCATSDCTVFVVDESPVRH